VISITSKSRYAVVALAELARSGERPVPIKELAERRDIPEQFLEQLFSTLRRAGLLTSHRGMRGGYTLSRPAEEITVLDVVQTLDGKVGAEADEVGRGRHRPAQSLRPDDDRRSGPPRGRRGRFRDVFHLGNSGDSLARGGEKGSAQTWVEVEPNPAAIAWYVQEAQRLLEDQQRRAESFKTRGGQVAGFSAAVLALIGGNAGAILGASEGPVRLAIGVALLAAIVCLATAVAIAVWGVIKSRPFIAINANEIANYTSERFLSEPELWRVHLRSLRALETATRQAEDEGSAAAEAIARALYAFLIGLGFSLISLGTLIAELI
jgi:Rrf2 family transcriptional regulator, cysteine metabolism repressor